MRQQQTTVISGVLAGLLAAALACDGNAVGPTGTTPGASGVLSGALAYGNTVQSSLSVPGERDNWTFESSAGDVVSIGMAGQGLGDPYLELYSPDGTQIASDDDGGAGLDSFISEYTLTQTGTYRIVARAYSSGTGGYALGLALAPPRDIMYGETVSDTLTFYDLRHSWAFQGEAGDVATIEMAGRGSLTDPYLELCGPGGSLLITSDATVSSLTTLIDGYTLPETGRYRIVARSATDWNGPYDLTLTQIELHAIAYGQTLSGEAPADSTPIYWQFQGSIWDVATISVSGQGVQNTTTLTLHAPDNSVLAQSVLVDGVPTIADYVLFQSGVYRIVLESGNGSYDLALSRAQLQERPVTRGQTASGELTEDTPVALWTFEGVAGEAVEVAITGEGQGGNLRASFFAPGDLLITQGQSAASPPSVRLRSSVLPANGTYWVIVQSVGGYVGQYTVAVNQAESQVGAIAYGQTVTGELTDAELEQRWTFEGQAGDVINVSMVTLGGNLTDTYLDLYGPNGEWLFSDDDSGGNLSALIRDFNLPYTGTYEIAAGSFSDSQTGPYELALGRIEYDQRTATYITYGDTLTGTLTELDQEGYWFFEGDAGDVVTLIVTGQGDLQTPQVELTGPDGTTVTGATEGGVCTIAGYELPASGVYNIVVRPLVEGRFGAYELALTGP